MPSGTKYFVSAAYEKKRIEDVISMSNDVKMAVCLKDENRHTGNVYMIDIDTANQISHQSYSKRNRLL